MAKRTRHSKKKVGGLFIEDSVATVLAAVGAYSLLAPLASAQAGGKRKKRTKSHYKKKRSSLSNKKSSRRRRYH